MLARENNFLLGFGERLTEPVKVPHSSGEKKPPYDIKTARNQVSNWLHGANDEFNELPSDACPKDKVTVIITLHPRYISKSDFPSELFNEVGLQVVGGRPARIKPKNWGINKHPEEAITDELFVISSRKSFRHWATDLYNWDDDNRASLQLTRLEHLKAFKAIDKIYTSNNANDEVLLEVVLHGMNKQFIEMFESYALRNNGIPNMDYLRYVRGLAFIPVHTTNENIKKIADFSLIRVIREMPRLRKINTSSTQGRNLVKVQLPSSDQPIDTDLKAAIFDGGISKKTPLLKWVNLISPPDVGNPDPRWVRHGTNVTSAALFGPLSLGEEANQPICTIDHIRVLDTDTGQNGDYEYYDVLDRIIDTLKNKSYEFVNISLGPDIPIDDGEVTRWTASLDELLAGADKLVTVAVGNTGEYDSTLKLNRIQPPSDGVNVLSVGSCDNQHPTKWQRAGYSSVGPGRCPGIIKPDGVIFGGSNDNPFFVYEPKSNLASGEKGTSLSAPYLLRTAIGVKAHLREDIRLLTVKGLLIHRATRGKRSLIDVGWGKFESNFNMLLTCNDDEALVLFQGELPLKEHLRALIPLPDVPLQGKVTVTATLVISPEVDPQFPNAYTRSGLEVIFRPDSSKLTIKEDGSTSTHAKTKSFFSQKMMGLSEYELRGDGHKWEPCLKAKRNFYANKLNKPCFDIYYHHRYEGKAASDPKPIPYALIISVKAPKNINFYNEVVKTYSNILIPLQSRISIRVNN